MLRRLVLISAISSIAVLATTTVALADDERRIVDISHQVADMQKKLRELQAKGQMAKTGKLAEATDCSFGD